MQRVGDRLWRIALAAARQPKAGYVVTLVAVAALTALLLPLRPWLSLLNIGLLYLLLVVLIAARWGWGPGLFASVVAHLTVNFFFVPPLHHFIVEDPANVLALLAFLGVAALTSSLLARARTGEAAARRREQEVAILYELSRLIIVGPDLASTLSTICERVRQVFTVESCTVLLPGAGGLAPVAGNGPLDAVPASACERRAADEALATGRTVVLGDGGRRRPRIIGMKDHRVPTVYAPLCVGGRVTGVLRAVGRLRTRAFAADELRLLEAFADEAALAVDRDRLLHEAARAEALQEADRLKSALLSAVSHDLRTPLASIKAAASSLLQADVQWDAATRREFLSAIDEETDRLSRLVGNLLDLSRIEGGALRPEKDWYDVGELLETVAGRLGRTVTDHRVRLDVAPDVGEVLLDYVQIGQVLANLIENAAKFAPKGTEIHLSARRRDGAVAVSVADQGPGIPAAERARVFEKFHRIGRTGQHVVGTGLGLAISKGLVEAHGGHIWVEDAPGRGARFVFSLPAPAPPPSALALAPAEAR